MKTPKPAAKPAPKAKPFSIRLMPDVRGAALDKAGQVEDRPAAYTALRSIVEDLKEKGLSRTTLSPRRSALKKKNGDDEES